MKVRLLLAGLALISGLTFLCLDRSPSAFDDTIDLEVSESQVHTHVHSDDCVDCQGGPIRRRSVEMDESADWMDGDVGEKVSLGFGIAGAVGGRVTMRESFEDGRLAISIKLSNGYDFFVVRNGTEWEGRAMPDAGGNGWRVRSEGDQIIIEELEFGALICAWDVDREGEVAGLPPVYGPPVVEESSALEVGESLPLLLNSLPDANGVIYLDFDGEIVSGTQWNSSYNGGSPINAGPSGFSDSKIETVWKGVSEDYRPFNVNVTTDRAVFDSYPVERRAMLVFTPDNEWYGSAGGVAYVDVFGSSSFDAPGWVFTDQLANSANYASEAASHEAGHILGLRHDGTSSLGYYEGHGSGATSWAPIMGVGYYSTVTQWSKGEYPNANRFEDDLQIISKTYNGLGYRPDDHKDSIAEASAMLEAGSDQISGTGVIERNTDVDVLSFQTSGGLVVLNATNSSYDPNLDIRFRLLTSSGGEFALSDADGNLDASISVTVPAGDYFVEIEGTGNGNLTSGYSDYGSLGAYSISGTAPRVSTLAATIVSPSVESLKISEGAGLVLDGFVSGGNPGWEVVSASGGGSVIFSAPNSSDTNVVFSGAGSYLLRLNADGGGVSAADEVTVVVESMDSLSSDALSLDLGPDRLVYTDRVVLQSEASAGGGASISGYDWSILSGSGQLSATNIAQPELWFSSAGEINLGLRVDYGIASLFQELRLTASYRETQVLASADVGKTFSPINGDLGDSWRLPVFDDSQWQSGLLGAGYEVVNGSGSGLYSELIGSGLDVESTMYKKTAGCYIRSAFVVQDSSKLLSMTLHVRFDDGFVAYLNGVEVARSNAPVGSPVWNSIASSDRLDSAALTPVDFSIELLPGLLVDGTNVLAVHGMNSAVSTGEREFLLVPEISVVEAITPFDLTMDGTSDPSLAATTADADGDGRANLLEHGAGTSPTETDEALSLVSLLDDTTAALDLPETPPADVRYTLLHSTQLGGSWTPVAIRTGSGPWTSSPIIDVSPLGDGRERTCFKLGEGVRGFLRLKMELVVP